MRYIRSQKCNNIIFITLLGLCLQELIENGEMKRFQVFRARKQPHRLHAPRLRSIGGGRLLGGEEQEEGWESASWRPPPPHQTLLGSKDQLGPVMACHKQILAIRSHVINVGQFGRPLHTPAPLLSKAYFIQSKLTEADEYRFMDEITFNSCEDIMMPCTLSQGGPKPWTQTLQSQLFQLSVSKICRNPKSIN